MEKNKLGIVINTTKAITAQAVLEPFIVLMMMNGLR